MPKSIQQLSGNLWKPSAAKLDGPSKLNNRLVKPKSFTALPPETPAEANFIKKNGPVNSESWKKSFPPKPPRKKASSAPKKLPSNPLSSMVPNAAPGHPVLPSGKPNQVFYSNQSNQLANVLSGAPKSPVQRARPFTANELGQLKQANPLAHDRYAALAPKQMQGVQSFGPMNDLTMLIPKSAGGKKSSAPSRFMPRVDPNQFEEIFSATNPKSGNPKALGTRQSGDNWYMFGTEVGEGIQKPSSAGKGTFGRGDEAASWFAPESYVAGDLPGGKPGPGMGSKAVIDDVQGIMEGPWQDYLKGPAVGDGEHGVQAVHGSSDGNGFDTFMGQFDKAKGILGSIQSAANSIQSLANLAGLADSLGKFSGMLGSLSEFSIPSSPGEMVTSLLKGSGCLGPPAPKTDATASVATGVDGIVVTIGGAGAEADGNARLDQIGKNESGDGSQSQGEGSDKSVSKDSTGGNVEIGKSDNQPTSSNNGPESEPREESGDNKSNENGAAATETPEPSLDDLENSEGELDPDKLTSRDEREVAYGKWKEKLGEAGGEAAKIKFPEMAEEVTDDLGGSIANDGLLYGVLGKGYGDNTEEFLEAGNDELYRFNDKMFNKLESNPNELFDPTQYVEGAKNDQLGRPPKNALEFDLQMVKAEQSQLEEVIKSQMPSDPQQRQDVLKEINTSLSLSTNDYIPDPIEYLGGKITGYEVEAVSQASEHLGRNIDFSRQEDRRAIGYAAAFRAHGYNQATYNEFMKTGTVPSTRPLNSVRDAIEHPRIAPGSPIPNNQI